MNRYPQSGPTSTGLRRNLKKLARRLRIKPLYQEERAAVFGDRWEAVRKRLGAEDRSLIDIGCNMGRFTAAAAKSGMVAIGFDPMEEAISRARRLHAAIPGCGFVWMDINPGTVTRIPRADVILCLSVHHYWSRLHGEDGAWQIIAELFDRCGKLFFEPASSHGRYGQDVPDFIENDADSIDAYVRRRFAAMAPDSVVTLASTTASINKEQFRAMYFITRP